MRNTVALAVVGKAPAPLWREGIKAVNAVVLLGLSDVPGGTAPVCSSTWQIWEWRAKLMEDLDWKILP